ncbi:elongation factor 1-gamma [Cordyceps javanica]|uniref:Elongation factor 1-gamma n=1 Tax=Cordyceps javanica TaxID=43265 RepID=A0A545VBT4_9HYPO|nr:elongation factor 1-gamma [Cordyceps javanica]TQW11263.1 elongation factor 1-gamma [Cordyceps javanica]
MAFGTLFASEGNPRTTAIKAVAKANGLDVKVTTVDLTAARTPEHLAGSPVGKVPAFVGEDGFTLHEAVAIAIYFTSQNEKTTLLGKTKQDYASILKWMSFFNNDVLNALAGQYLPLVGRAPYSKQVVDDAAKVADKLVGAVEKYLTEHTYLVGERLTLADLFAAGIISRGFQYFYDTKWRQANPATTRWYETIVNQPIYSDVVGKVEFIDKVALPNVAPKVEAPKAAAAPAAAAAAAPAAAEDAPAPKPKHPCEALGKSSFALDDLKRFYSNNDTPVAMKYFWENVPFDEYSIWKVDYKYNDELTLTFMSNNLIGGFNTRLEGSRKYVFGTASVYGQNNDSVIQGAFVIRGQEYEPVFDVAPDYESYTFTKLDPKKEEDRAFVEANWGWEKPAVVNGKEYPHADGKVFK